MKKRLIETLMVQTETYHTEDMQVFIAEQVEKIEGCELVFDRGNIYIRKGDAETYPCIIAHTDTVHDRYEDFQIFETSHGELFSMDCSAMQQVGIGGDDKVGVWVALEILRTVDVCKVAFFRDEEHGCLGSAEALMGWFTDVEFVLQCDRQGYKDFVRKIYSDELYDEDFSSEISPLLSKYDKRECLTGGMTDVWQLVKNGLEVCCANISCGYYSPHTDEEFVDVKEAILTFKLVKDIFNKLSGTVWKYDKKVRVKKYKHRNSLIDYYLTGETYQDEFSDIPFAENKDEIEYIMDGDTCPSCENNDTLADKEWNMLYCFTCEKYTEQGEVPEEITDPYHLSDEIDDELVKAANKLLDDSTSTNDVKLKKRRNES